MRLGKLLKTIDLENAGLHIVTDEELKKCQNLLLEMIIDIAGLCDKYDIEWLLSGGSILGAVRHKGFIPWDDDVDIFMTRENVVKLQKVFPEIADKYTLAMPGDDRNLFHYPRIYKKGTKVRSVQSAGETHGLVLDIFVLENAYNNKFLRYLHGIECTIYLFIDTCVRMRACKDSVLKYGGNNKKLRNAVNLRATLGKIFAFKTIEQWMEASDKCFSKVKDNQSKYVVCPSGAMHYFGEMFIREKLCSTIEVPFESYKVKIPEDYHYYLTMRYGKNYMTPPQKDKIERHIYVEFDLGD